MALYKQKVTKLEFYESMDGGNCHPENRKSAQLPD
jgi:hypothetical protein